MPKRPTISLYTNGHIQEIFAYEDCSLPNLLYNCVEMVDSLGTAAKREEIRECLYLDPTVEYDEESLLAQERASDFDAILDLTDRVVFFRTQSERESGTYEEAKSSRRLIDRCRAWDEACEEWGVWVGGSLASFSVLGHVHAALDIKASRLAPAPAPAPRTGYFRTLDAASEDLFPDNPIDGIGVAYRYRGPGEPTSTAWLNGDDAEVVCVLYLDGEILRYGRILEWRQELEGRIFMRQLLSCPREKLNELEPIIDDMEAVERWLSRNCKNADIYEVESRSKLIDARVLYL